MIYSFSGPPGQGKSEAISFFQEEGFLTIPTKRADCTTSIVQFQKIQEEILDDKFAIISERSNDLPLIIESSFVDMFIYSMLILGVHYDHSTWLNSFYNKCIHYQKIIDLTILFPYIQRENQGMNEFSAESFYILAEHYLNLNNFIFMKGHGLDNNIQLLIKNEELNYKEKDTKNYWKN